MSEASVLDAPRTEAQKSAAGVSISNVNLSYGTNHVLKDVNLEIEPGEFFAFLGPSGCGKTTLLRLIAGFNTADTGMVRIRGEDISALPPWKRDVGLVFQSYALWPHMTVRKNVAFGLEERRLPRAEIDKRVNAALEIVGLSHLADRRPSQLSGGQQQRVAVARTIVVEPKVLLLDEPLSNLDAKLRVQVRRELRDLQRRLGITTIFVTHDQEEANTICDRIAVMSEGVVQQVGTPMELYERPANLFVAGFLGAANILPGAIVEEGGKRFFELAGGARVAAPAQAEAGARLVFRPQHAFVAAPEAGGGLHGEVVHREFLGSIIRYGVRLGETDVTIDAPFVTGDALFVEGDRVAVTLPTERTLWLSK
jgi:iron(III) transport system ATP-binding protein